MRLGTPGALALIRALNRSVGRPLGHTLMPVHHSPWAEAAEWLRKLVHLREELSTPAFGISYPPLHYFAGNVT